MCSMFFFNPFLILALTWLVQIWKGFYWGILEAGLIPGGRWEGGSEDPQEAMGLWEEVPASTTLRLWPVCLSKFVYSWRLNCCGPPEGGHCGQWPPAEHGLHGPRRPECSHGLPQRMPEKAPHLRDRRGQLLWEQPDRSNRDSSNPSKIWCASAKAAEPSASWPLFPLQTKRNAAFLSFPTQWWCHLLTTFLLDFANCTY